MLDEIRDKITNIDFEIQNLLEKRLDFSREVADAKKNKLPILNNTRESQILNSIKSPYIREIYKEIMTQSRLYQLNLNLDKFIVLIGMPGSGKSTVGAILSTLLNCNFYDLDKEIESEQKCCCGEIIEKKGEKYFRKCEGDIFKKIMGEKVGVVATGGGFITVESNANLLKQQIVITVDRNLSEIIATVANDQTRPLSTCEEDVKTLYNQRKQLYKNYSQVTFGKGLTPENTAKEIVLWLESRSL